VGLLLLLSSHLTPASLWDFHHVEESDKVRGIAEFLAWKHQEYGQEMSARHALILL
jgi:hypothetical protein